MSRRHNALRIKKHLSYRADELAETLDVNIRTVRAWKAQGLRCIPGLSPQEFAAADIIQFIHAKNKPRQPLAPGEIFCVACKRPQRPFGDEATLVRRLPTNADLSGRCPDCGRRMMRRVSLVKLDLDRGNLMVTYEDISAPIPGSPDAPHISSLGGVAA